MEGKTDSGGLVIGFGFTLRARNPKKEIELLLFSDKKGMRKYKTAVEIRGT